MAELYSRQVWPKQVKTGENRPRAQANLTMLTKIPTQNHKQEDRLLEDHYHTQT